MASWRSWPTSLSTATTLEPSPSTALTVARPAGGAGPSFLPITPMPTQLLLFLISLASPLQPSTNHLCRSYPQSPASSPPPVLPVLPLHHLLQILLLPWPSESHQWPSESHQWSISTVEVCPAFQKCSRAYTIVNNVSCFLYIEFHHHRFSITCSFSDVTASTK